LELLLINNDNTRYNDYCQDGHLMTLNHESRGLITLDLGMLVLAHGALADGGIKGIMADGERQGLRGPVKSSVITSGPGMMGAEGKTYPEFRSEFSSEFDVDGRVVVTRHRYSNDSYSTTRYDYDASGRLLKTRSGTEGEANSETTYFYDQQNRMTEIINSKRPANPVSFRYDERGRKSMTVVSLPEDYRPNVASGGSPFDRAAFPPNLRGGGSATTIYDELDRAIEAQVRNANGELIEHTVRTYDAQGRVLEEIQTLDAPERMFSVEQLDEVRQKQGLSADQFRQEFRADFAKLMAGRPGMYSVSYRYDSQGRVQHTSRRILNTEEDMETLYNERGDVVSEIRWRKELNGGTDSATAAPRPPSFSEVRYSYQYDSHGNWTEKTMSVRSSPDGAFEPRCVMTQTLTYY
jgi:hypothetical protein